jgi:hypothetical protein
MGRGLCTHLRFPKKKIPRAGKIIRAAIAATL